MSGTIQTPIAEELLENLDCTSDQDLEVAGQAIRALSSPARLRILCQLFDGEKSVVELTRLVQGHTQSSISQHLAFLHKSGIVSNRKHKTRMLYRINDVRMHQMLRMIVEVFCHRPARRSQMRVDFSDSLTA